VESRAAWLHARVAVEVTDKPSRPQSLFDLLRDRVAFDRLLRGAVLGFLQDVAARDWEAAAARVDPGAAGRGRTAQGKPRQQPAGSRTPSSLTSRPADASGSIREGRAAKHLHRDETPETWTLAQVLVVNPDGRRKRARERPVAALACRVPARKSRVVLEFDGVCPVGGAPGEAGAENEG
jgi:hypothetical protein